MMLRQTNSPCGHQNSRTLSHSLLILRQPHTSKHQLFTNSNNSHHHPIPRYHQCLWSPQFMVLCLLVPARQTVCKPYQPLPQRPLIIPRLLMHRTIKRAVSGMGRRQLQLLRLWLLLLRQLQLPRLQLPRLISTTTSHHKK